MSAKNLIAVKSTLFCDSRRAKQLVEEFGDTGLKAFSAACAKKIQDAENHKREGRNLQWWKLTEAVITGMFVLRPF
jgi:ribosomal protein L4